MYGTITEVCRDYANRELIIDSLISKLENLLGLRPTSHGPQPTVFLHYIA